MSERPGRYDRSFAGMVGAMIVLLVVVVAFVLLRDVGRETPAGTAEPVDYERPASYARTQVDFPLLAPDELPPGWIATSVRYTAGREPSWHLGMLTEDRKYVGLEQQPRAVGDMVEEFVDPKATRGADVRIDGVAWETWTDERDVALVRRTPEVTTLVVGAVPQQTLRELVASLS